MYQDRAFASHNKHLQSICSIVEISHSVQLPVKVEHSCAVMDNASDLLTVVMGLKTALMAVMRLDVVSYQPGLCACILYCTM